MTPLFIDSSALVALNDKIDADYIRAGTMLSKISSDKFNLYLSTNIFIETLTIISQRVGKEKGIALLDELRSGKYIVIHPDDQLIAQAEDIFRTIKSKNVSYGDCISFAVMRRYGIQWVFSFDIHFKKMGFKRIGIDGFPR